MGLFDIFGSSAAQEAAGAQRNALTQGYGQLSGLYDTGRNALTTNYTSALQPYQELYGKSSAGYDAYADASGANGPAGLARAQSNFQTSPGFNFQLNTGIDALTRAGNAKGVATGNVLREAQDYGSGLASQEWGNYVNRLAPFLSGAQASAGGLSGVFTGLGQQLGQSYFGQGQQALNTQKAVGDAAATAAMDQNRAGAQTWSTIGSAATLAA